MEKFKQNEFDPGADPERITIEDCIERYDRKGEGVVLEDGHVTGFIE